MATAKKLPSGSWRVRVYSHTEEITLPDGTKKEKKVYKSFTCDDVTVKGKRKCEAEAAAWAVQKENHKESDLTYGEALDEYIRLRSAVLSPSTIREYKRSRRADFQSLMDMRLDSITQNDIQKAVNYAAATHSPKSVKNMHGLVTAVFDIYRPDFRIKTDLPKKVRNKLTIPSESEIKRLLTIVEGTPLEIPILLAAFGPMRRGEICALDSDHIVGNVIHVEFSLALDENDNWIKKRPKSFAGDRYIEFPDFVIDKLRGIDGQITTLTPSMLSDRFAKLIKRENLPHFRFHDLRHYSASMQHALGVPDQYIMERGGWGSDGILKSVYRHALDDIKKTENEKINNRFSKLYDTKYDMKTKNP